MELPALVLLALVVVAKVEAMEVEDVVDHGGSNEVSEKTVVGPVDVLLEVPVIVPVGKLPSDVMRVKVVEDNVISVVILSTKARFARGKDFL